MRIVVFIFMVPIFMLVGLITKGQSINFLELTQPKPYRVEASVLLNDRPAEDVFASKGQALFFIGMDGVLTIGLEKKACGSSTNALSFQVAIKNKRTNTTWIYTPQEVQALELKDVLSKCEPGDRLILMPTDQKYALPRHEFLITDGC